MSDTVSNATLLENADLFRLLDRPSLEAVIASAVTWPVAQNASLLKQGDDPDHLFIVTHGRFKMNVLSKDGVQTLLRFMDPGDVIGCAAVFRRIPYPATAIAVTDSKVLGWTAARFDQLLRRYPQLAANALALMGERTEEMLQRLRAITSEPIEQRLARALLRFANRTASGPGPADVVVKLSRQELAELADTSLYTASRVISSWRRAGIVAGGRGRIVVRDFKRLSQIAENATGVIWMK